VTGAPSPLSGVIYCDDSRYPNLNFLKLAPALLPTCPFALPRGG